jgi:hypothetical protein
MAQDNNLALGWLYSALRFFSAAPIKSAALQYLR